MPERVLGARAEMPERVLGARAETLGARAETPERVLGARAETPERVLENQNAFWARVLAFQNAFNWSRIVAHSACHIKSFNTTSGATVHGSTLTVRDASDPRIGW